MLPKMAGALAQKGLSSFRFDFPGNGESDGTFKYANMVDEVRSRKPSPPVCSFVGRGTDTSRHETCAAVLAIILAESLIYPLFRPTCA